MAALPLGKLTTHILDTSAGKPAADVRIDLFKIEPDAPEKEQKTTKLRTSQTNADGRCDEPLLKEGEFLTGEYELVFYIGDYFDDIGLRLPEPKFIDVVVIRFGVADNNSDYHVPLLVSPFGYSTYRGS